MALCKPDLVAAVLRQLGHEVPDPETLTKAVFNASAGLRKEFGLADNACLLLSPVRADWYEGSVREVVEEKGGYTSGGGTIQV